MTSNMRDNDTSAIPHKTKTQEGLRLHRLSSALIREIANSSLNDHRRARPGNGEGEEERPTCALREAPVRFTAPRPGTNGAEAACERRVTAAARTPHHCSPRPSDSLPLPPQHAERAPSAAKSLTTLCSTRPSNSTEPLHGSVAPLPPPAPPLSALRRQLTATPDDKDTDPTFASTLAGGNTPHRMAPCVVRSPSTSHRTPALSRSSPTSHGTGTQSSTVTTVRYTVGVMPRCGSVFEEMARQLRRRGGGGRFM